jgi:hypothetical protein
VLLSEHLHGGWSRDSTITFSRVTNVRPISANSLRFRIIYAIKKQWHILSKSGSMSILHEWEIALPCPCIIMCVRQQFWLYKRGDLLHTSGELIQRCNLEELQNNTETQLRTEPCSFRVENSSTHDVDNQQQASVIALCYYVWAWLHTHTHTLTENLSFIVLLGTPWGSVLREQMCCDLLTTLIIPLWSIVRSSQLSACYQVVIVIRCDGANITRRMVKDSNSCRDFILQMLAIPSGSRGFT